MAAVVRELTEALSERYIVERDIGRGAMATVFLARELHHNRHVALKVLDPELTHSIAAERFIREIRTAAKLTHPHILPVHDSGKAGGLLYYVTPYVEGQTLRACLQKEGRLPVHDAISIAEQIAGALAYAHEQGIVHRDIKPENILLTAGRQVWVADFGLAHALSSGADARLTATGVSVGSPLYMSPEQASGSAHIDARADIYALGCLLYEMLSGVTPFTGHDIPSVLARHLTATPVRVSQLNKEVPAHVETAVCKALEKSPVHRYKTAREFQLALAGKQHWVHRSALRYGIGAVVIATLAIILVLSSRGERAGWVPSLNWARAADLDTARYVVMPFVSNGVLDAEAQQRMQEALRQWRGIEVVDLITVQDAVQRAGGGALDFREMRLIARRIRAGRFIRGSIDRIDGRYRLEAAVYDASDRNRVVDRATVRDTDSGLPLDSLFAMLADSLLFVSDGERAVTPYGTRSRPAREAQRQGQLALSAWDVERADSFFSSAIRHDPEYAQAYFALAQLRGWLSDSPAQWEVLTERAVKGKALLTPRAQRLSEALHALSTSRYQQACSVYDSLATADPLDFSAAYGSADCRRRDKIVVADASSPTGWRLRSNYYRAILSYRRALKLLPATHKAFSANSFERVRDILFTSTSHLVRAESEKGESFVAAATKRGDTLVFLPYPADADLRVQTTPEAVAWLRGVYYDIARDWADQYPSSASALEALTLASDLRGDVVSLTLIRRARELATSDADRARLGALQVILGLKRSAPHDRAGLDAVRMLADSLIKANPAESNWSKFAASIALVVGKPDYAARAARAAVDGWSDTYGVPRRVWGDAQALLIYASIGLRPDSMRILEDRVAAHLSRSRNVPPWLGFQLTLARPASMAFPTVRLTSLDSKHASGDYVLAAEAAFARGDRDGARKQILSRASLRGNIADLQFDALYPEAWLLFNAKDANSAAMWIDPTLNALPDIDPIGLEDPARLAGLLRTFELRARIAGSLGDRQSARKWADALLTLWQDADPILNPVVADLRQIR